MHNTGHFHFQKSIRIFKKKFIIFTFNVKMSISKNGWFQYTTHNFSRLTHRAFASIRALPRIEIWWNLFSFHAVYLVHFCRELVNKSSECLGVRVSHFFSQSSHHPADMSRSRISINPLRLDCPEPFYWPEVIPFWSEKQRIAIFVSPECWSMGGEMFFHELLIFICGMWLREVLFKNHITVFCKHFPLVDRQTLCFLSLQNVAHNDFVQDFLTVDATVHASFEMVVKFHCLWHWKWKMIFLKILILFWKWKWPVLCIKYRSL